jgi:predicted Zn-dependent peptidase
MVINRFPTSSMRRSILDSRITTLANGLRVISINLPHVESASVAAFVNVGSRNETAEENGISHVLEHMAFKGTTTRSCHDVLSELEQLGADVNAFTSRDRTAYYVNGLREHIPTLIELIADVLKNSTFPEDELERERKAILQEIAGDKDDHQTCAYQLHDRVLYGDQNLGRPIIGTVENVKKFTRDDLIAFMKQYYTGVNMIVGVVGNINHDDVLDLVKAEFETIERGMVNTSPVAVYEGGYQEQEFDIEQSHIILSFPAVNSVDPLHYAEAVASAVLSDGMSSPLFSEVREKRGLVYTITTFTDMLDDVGTFYLYAGATPENFEELFPIITDELLKLTQAVNPKDLERAKNQLRVRLTRRQERGFGLLSNSIENLFTYGYVPSLNETLDKIAAVNAEDVMSAFKRWLASKPSLTISGPGADGTIYDDILRKFGQPTLGSLTRLTNQLLKDPEIKAGYDAQEIIEAARYGDQTA